MIVNKLILVDNIVRDIADNSTGMISPRDVRQNMLDVVTKRICVEENC